MVPRPLNGGFEKMLHFFSSENASFLLQEQLFGEIISFNLDALGNSACDIVGIVKT